MSRRLSTRQMIINIIANRENTETHSRIEYWADQIIWMVRKDENKRLRAEIRKGVEEYYKVAPKAAEPILRIVDGVE